jgi:hypothetical protein
MVRSWSGSTIAVLHLHSWGTMSSLLTQDHGLLARATIESKKAALRFHQASYFEALKKHCAQLFSLLLLTSTQVFVVSAFSCYLYLALNLVSH